ncbi:MAG: 4Fe-4S binding protein [Actinomycetota bacterium]
MAIDERDALTPPDPQGTGLGLAKGLGVTLKHALRRASTQQYPKVKPDLPPRTRGVIALKEANCTVCYKCSRECPDWCIYIDAHKETHDPASGGKSRSAKVLDRFAIDFALCMYCGICVEVCPFDALFWSPEFEYAEYELDLLTHEKEKLEEWTYPVLPPPELEVGAVGPAVAEAPSVAAAPAPDVAAPAEAAPVQAAPSTPAGAAPAPGAGHAEVEADAETYERVLAEQLGQGKDRRVAEGQAKRAAMIAARKKAGGA